MQDELQNFFSHKELESRYGISNNTLLKFLKEHKIAINTIFGKKYISKAEIWELEKDLQIVFPDNHWFTNEEVI